MNASFAIANGSLKNCVHNSENHSSFDFTSAAQYKKYVIYHFNIHSLLTSS